MITFNLKKILAIGLFFSTTSVFGNYCFTTQGNTSVTNCNPQEVQKKLTEKDGFAILFMFSGVDKLKSVMMIPDSNQYILDKITEETMTFKKSGKKYEWIHSTGCIEKGSISETKDKITLITESLGVGSNCDRKRQMMDFMKKMNADKNPNLQEFRKIYN